MNYQSIFYYKTEHKRIEGVKRGEGIVCPKRATHSRQATLGIQSAYRSFASFRGEVADDRSRLDVYFIIKPCLPIVLSPCSEVCTSPSTSLRPCPVVDYPEQHGSGFRLCWLLPPFPVRSSFAWGEKREEPHPWTDVALLGMKWGFSHPDIPDLNCCIRPLIRRKVRIGILNVQTEC